MKFGLKGRHVAILAADGVDGAQVGGARTALSEAGVVADVLATRGGEVTAAAGDAVGVDRTFDVCHSADYDALVIPGGQAAVDALRREGRALQFVREFMAADKPVAAIGDGVRMLVAADAVAGRSVAAPRELADAVREAGGELVDRPLYVDEKLITARGEGDLSELNTAIVREFSNRVDEARVDQLSEQSFPASDPPPGPVAVGGEGASTSLHLDPNRSEAADGSADQRGRP
ncbi:MAG: DJ-1/PfpI family protein [Gemmatimonadaceae bacterium]